jgi:hypothetical protein
MQLSRNLDLAVIAYSSSSPVCEVDAADCEGVLFIAVPGTTVARTGSMALKAGATTTGFVNCSSTHTLTSTGATRDVLIVDVYKPAKRWIGCTYSATADMEARMLAIKYGLRKHVSTFSATAVTNLTVPVVAGGVKRVISPTSST